MESTRFSVVYLLVEWALKVKLMCDISIEKERNVEFPILIEMRLE